MPDNNTVKLAYPITVPDGEGGVKEITELVFCKRMKAKHLKSLPDSFYEKQGEKMSAKEIVPLVASMCGHPESVIDELDTDDLKEVALKLQGFIGVSQVDGKN